MIRLVAFLGNVGVQYEKTRHNVAWQFAECLPFYNELNWQEKFKGLYAAKEFEERRIYFLKPFTLMNLSGESVGALATFYKIKPEEILVVHDELELPLGTFGLKWAGGLAGHNGLRSVKAALGTADFWRLRFGLTKPSGRDIADYVLSNFSADEAITLRLVFEKAAEVFMKAILSNDPQRLLPKCGKVKVVESSQLTVDS